MHKRCYQIMEQGSRVGNIMQDRIPGKKVNKRIRKNLAHLEETKYLVRLVVDGRFVVRLVVRIQDK